MPPGKPPVPQWRWGLWWTILGAAVFVFYVLLTPIWLGLRAARMGGRVEVAATASLTAGSIFGQLY